MNACLTVISLGLLLDQNLICFINLLNVVMNSRAIQKKFIEERNWDQFHSPRNVLLALVSSTYRCDREPFSFCYATNNYYCYLLCILKTGEVGELAELL